MVEINLPAIISNVWLEQQYNSIEAELHKGQKK